MIDTETSATTKIHRRCLRMPTLRQTYYLPYVAISFPFSAGKSKTGSYSQLLEFVGRTRQRTIVIIPVSYIRGLCLLTMVGVDAFRGGRFLNCFSYWTVQTLGDYNIFCSLENIYHTYKGASTNQGYLSFVIYKQIVVVKNFFWEFGNVYGHDEYQCNVSKYDVGSEHNFVLLILGIYLPLQEIRYTYKLA